MSARRIWRGERALTTVAVLVFAALAFAPRPAAAQGHPAPAEPHRPVIAPLLPDGAYDLTLTPASVQQRALAAAQPITVGAQIAHGGAEVTITTSDGMTLHGASSTTHLKASGAMQRSTLTLELGGSGTNASGTFQVAAPGGQRLTGTATVAPAPRYQVRTAKHGCSGFWDCVKTITGFDWSVFGG